MEMTKNLAYFEIKIESASYSYESNFEGFTSAESQPQKPTNQTDITCDNTRLLNATRQ